MTAEEAIIVGAIVTGLLTAAGVIISTYARSHDSGFSTLVKAFEALANQNKSLVVDLEAERKGRAHDRTESQKTIEARDARIAELERQLVRAYGGQPPGSGVTSQ
jgi:hypothetical protein